MAAMWWCDVGIGGDGWCRGDMDGMIVSRVRGSKTESTGGGVWVWYWLGGIAMAGMADVKVRDGGGDTID